MYVEAGETIDETVEKGIEKLKSKGILESGDLIVISGGNKALNSLQESKIVSGVARI